MDWDFETNHEIIVQARRNATGPVWDYLAGGSETETSMRRNRQALDSLALKPRVLRDVSNIDLTTTILGHPSSMPLFLSPVASLQIVTPAGSLCCDEAADELGLINIQSGHTQPGFEEIGYNSLHPKFYQIYVRGGREWYEDLLKKVKDSGFSALVVTVDTSVYSNRERQVLNGWEPPSRRNSAGREHLAGLSWDIWDDMARIWDGPMIIKGVGTAEDALMALDHGASAIYVSNHGGRQLDHDRGSIGVLPEIVDAVDGKAEIYVDGGFMRGTDIVKAVALGARAVGIGKMQAFALAAGGQKGLMNCLDILKTELTIAMGLLGVTALDELSPDYLCKARPVAPSHEMSAFPFIPGGRLT